MLHFDDGVTKDQKDARIFDGFSTVIGAGSSYRVRDCGTLLLLFASNLQRLPVHRQKLIGSGDADIQITEQAIAQIINPAVQR